MHANTYLHIISNVGKAAKTSKGFCKTTEVGVDAGGPSGSPNTALRCFWARWPAGSLSAVTTRGQPPGRVGLRGLNLLPSNHLQTKLPSQLLTNPICCAHLRSGRGWNPPYDGWTRSNRLSSSSPPFIRRWKIPRFKWRVYRRWKLGKGH